MEGCRGSPAGRGGAFSGVALPRSVGWVWPALLAPAEAGPGRHPGAVGGRPASGQAARFQQSGDSLSRG